MNNLWRIVPYLVATPKSTRLHYNVVYKPDWSVVRVYRQIKRAHKLVDEMNSERLINKCDTRFRNHHEPRWCDHNYPAICTDGYHWFGLKEAVKPPYTDEWKGKQIHLLRGQSDFLKYGDPEGDIEMLYRKRPTI